MARDVTKYLAYLIGITLFFTGVLAGLFIFYRDQLPPLSELQNYDMKMGSEVYDVNDKLIHVFAFEHRKRSNVREFPEYLINGLIAVEDRSFYDHWGVNLKSIVRSIIVDIVRGGYAQGASTITQQLARNMFLSLDKKLPRKIKEIMLAVKIEQNYSKDEILEMYLDKIYLGGGMYGVEAAARRYFNKEVSDLDIPEAAMIIGLIQLPNAYSPIKNPERARKRRDLVLHVMYKQKVISKEEYKEAVESEIKVVPMQMNEGAADYFLEQVRLIIENKYGTEKLFAGGMKIYTTLDYNLQVYADSIFSIEMREMEKRQRYKHSYSDFPPNKHDITTPYIQGGVYGIEPQTGYVRVLIGGRNFTHSKFNRITQARRQPGSAFKPIIYTAAIEKGYTPATIIKDEPLTFWQDGKVFWQPTNYDPKYDGYMRLREAINKSTNTVAVKTMVDVGPSAVLNCAKRFGFTTQIQPYYSTAIGASEVLPIDLITAYTAFANDGQRAVPIFIRRVEDRNGRVLETAKTEQIRVTDEKTAYIVSNLLRTVIDDGTGRGIRWRGYRWFAAGKTGTTDDFRDAWFIAFNRKLVLGIWVGFDDNHSMGRGQTGAVAALPAWAPIMNRAMTNMISSEDRMYQDSVSDRYSIPMPVGIITKKVSANTGLIPRNFNEESILEYFVEGTEPTVFSDSLKYNFYPTMYRENRQPSLIIDLGGRGGSGSSKLNYKAGNVIVPRRN